MTESPLGNARETADHAKALAEEAKENLEDTRTDDEEVADAGVEAAEDRPAEREPRHRADPGLTGPGAPMP
ncbi:hypothetical protein [Georgenia sp. AZ-5]|uniref:hypothetical protein n=1 Tax=Georgenia sp. AZ-5 TaxID=3367526 RepID=UPI0037542056